MLVFCHHVLRLSVMSYYWQAELKLHIPQAAMDIIQPLQLLSTQHRAKRSRCPALSQVRNKATNHTYKNEVQQMVNWYNRWNDIHLCSPVASKIKLSLSCQVRGKEQWETSLMTRPSHYPALSQLRNIARNHPYIHQAQQEMTWYIFICITMSRLWWSG